MSAARYFCFAVHLGTAVHLGVAVNPGRAVDFGVAKDVDFTTNRGIIVDAGVAKDYGICEYPGGTVMRKVLFLLNKATKIADLDIVSRDINQCFNAVKCSAPLDHSFVRKAVLLHLNVQPP